MIRRYYQVDVFTDRPWSGNPLAVIVGDDFLPDDSLQQIAAGLNFSETAFVIAKPDQSGSYPARVFTPVREIEFTGHPILGAAWVIREYLVDDPPDTVTLNLPVGHIPVTFEHRQLDHSVAWFPAPAITPGGVADHTLMADALGLSQNDLVKDLPVQQFSAGTSAMIVPLRSLDALRRAQLDLDRYVSLRDRGFPPLTYLFCREASQDGCDISARFFFEANGVREDPATGNGAAFLGAYLLLHTQQEASHTIGQGHNLGRPSRIHLQAVQTESGPDIRIGGSVVPVIHGTLA